MKCHRILLLFVINRNNKRILLFQGENTMLSYMTMLESEREKDKFQRIYQPMYHVALQILGDVPGTQDCVHDAFLKIISRMDQIPEA